MATESEIAHLRSIVIPTTLTDEELGKIIDESKNLSEAAARVWQMKAAYYSTVTDVSESGSSRKMGDMFRHAMQMVQYYGGMEDPDTGPTAGGRTRIARIVRE